MNFAALREEEVVERVWSDCMFSGFIVLRSGDRKLVIPWTDYSMMMIVVQSRRAKQNSKVNWLLKQPEEEELIWHLFQRQERPLAPPDCS